MNDDSILTTIKKMLGLDSSYDAFDTDIMVLINSTMMTLQQLGVGPTEGFTITGPYETWDDFLSGQNKMLEAVKSYIYICVRTIFDPPSTSFVLDALQKHKEELEWRLREQSEFYPGDDSGRGYWQKVDDETEENSEAGDD